MGVQWCQIELGLEHFIEGIGESGGAGSILVDACLDADLCASRCQYGEDGGQFKYACVGAVHLYPNRGDLVCCAAFGIQIGLKLQLVDLHIGRQLCTMAFLLASGSET